MHIPGADLSRKPFDFRQKWIALFVALDAVCIAIALWVVFGGSRVDDRLVFLGDEVLMLGSDTLCHLETNYRDSLPDFPDSAWNGWQIDRLETLVRARGDSVGRRLRFAASPAMPFMMVDVVLRTLRKAGLRTVDLVDSIGTVPVILRDEEMLIAERRWSSPWWPADDPDPSDSFLWFLMRSDTLVFLASGHKGVFERALFPARKDLDSTGKQAMKDSVRRWLAEASLGNSLDSIGIILSSQDSFQRVVDIVRLVQEASGKKPWLGKQAWRFDQFRLDFSDGARLDEIRRKHSKPSGPAIRVSGLDRLFFRKCGIGSYLASDAGEAGAWMPLEFDGRIAPSDRDKKWQDDWWYSRRDYPIPLNRLGHRLVVRQVKFLRPTWQSGPIWWAFYDNGIRGSVWFFQSGLSEEKELADYEIDTIEPLGPDGFRIHVRGVKRLDRDWIESGIDLDFDASGDVCSLKSVCNRFSWFGGKEFQTEESSVDGWIIRTVFSPPDSLLRTCGYRDPTRKGSPKFDWNHKHRIAQCITRWPDASSRTRATGEKSYIER